MIWKGRPHSINILSALLQEFSIWEKACHFVCSLLCRGSGIYLAQFTASVQYISLRGGKEREREEEMERERDTAISAPQAFSTGFFSQRFSLIIVLPHNAV